MKRQPLEGTKFGRLLVKEFRGVGPTKHSLYLCACICGNELVVRRSQLISGYTKSCGCLHKEQLSKRRRIHGDSNAVEYTTWKTMRARCHNDFCKDWLNYGGRGITVCDRWRYSYIAFLYDMGRRPSDAYSIDRINNDGNYEPSNCRWATRTEQNRNTRRCHA